MQNRTIEEAGGTPWLRDRILPLHPQSPARLYKTWRHFHSWPNICDNALGLDREALHHKMPTLVHHGWARQDSAAQPRHLWAPPRRLTSAGAVQLPPLTFRGGHALYETESKTYRSVHIFHAKIVLRVHCTQSSYLATPNDNMHHMATSCAHGSTLNTRSLALYMWGRRDTQQF